MIKVSHPVSYLSKSHRNSPSIQKKPCAYPGWVLRQEGNRTSPGKYSLSPEAAEITVTNFAAKHKFYRDKSSSEGVTISPEITIQCHQRPLTISPEITIQRHKRPLTISPEITIQHHQRPLTISPEITI